MTTFAIPAHSWAVEYDYDGESKTLLMLSDLGPADEVQFMRTIHPSLLGKLTNVECIG